LNALRPCRLMTGRDLDRLEIAAGELIAHILGGRAEAQDVKGAPDATIDFLILDLPNDDVVALEVTSAANSAVVSQNRAAFGRDWISPELGHNWMIGIGREDPKMSIRDLMTQVIPIVVLFERTGETAVEVRYDPQYQPRSPERSEEMHDAMVKMFDLGVYAARLWSEPEEGRPGQLIPSISQGLSSDPGQINELVVERAEKKIDKLRATEADERHLFVWMDSSHAEAELAFATLAPPPAPIIPEGIDVVWLVEPTGWPGSVRIWRLVPPDEWEVFPVPESYSLSL
jgi:hypothetical protein